MGPRASLLPSSFGSSKSCLPRSRWFLLLWAGPTQLSIIKTNGKRNELAADVTAALQAEPKAAQFFDGLAQFYRKKYLTWIDSTKKSPELRAERIAEMVNLLKAGTKERPR